MSGNVYRSPATIRVGPGWAYSTPSAAAAVAKDGDIVEILAGTYSADVAVWVQNNLTIRGVHGRAHLLAGGKSAEGKGIWVIKGNQTKIENIEFSGAAVSDGNGAGIRQEGAGLTLRGCYFHDNENGILAGENLSSDIVIENTEFANNGNGDGSTHNLYIGKVRSFTLRFSYSHHAKSGHNVKTRASLNYILYNRIMDEQDGTSSYAVDIPNGGTAYLIGNLLQQGPETENYHVVSYGSEGLSYSKNEIYVVNNTFVNDRHDGVFVRVQSGAAPVEIINNIFYGPGTTLSGIGRSRTNLTITKRGFLSFQSKDPGFVDAGHFDYRLRAISPAIDKGSDPGEVSGFSLKPEAQYVHVAKAQKRVMFKSIDIGAYEFAE